MATSEVSAADVSAVVVPSEVADPAVGIPSVIVVLREVVVGSTFATVVGLEGLHGEATARGARALKMVKSIVDFMVARTI